MIDFSLSEADVAAINAAHKEAAERIRPISQYYDEHEHEDPIELNKWRWERRKSTGISAGMGLAGPVGSAGLRRRELGRRGTGDVQSGAGAGRGSDHGIGDARTGQKIPETL